jgi:hypothetical protein
MRVMVSVHITLMVSVHISVSMCACVSNHVCLPGMAQCLSREPATRVPLAYPVNVIKKASDHAVQNL